MHPDFSGQLASQRRRDVLARAEESRSAQCLLAIRSAERAARRAQRRLLREARRVLRQADL